ncbi:MAG: UbiX family flavin prenyltransferase [Methanocellales archaeon]|nr:UbiX family flavin prenyltransferase [Methanocellales archaeon]MDD3291365.1 UbiX family flavin prenyltransferase [Methanocellales archaeon]MDD5234745.1 UbiX family flavin prenyltransferase [Methanocellales archaeon]MDD5484904.1 UbiX family flavin prenyltransferase [Methanocellales archaeon]
MNEIVVGISGASGVQYGVRLLEVLRDRAETHLIISENAKLILKIETEYELEDVTRLASHAYAPDDLTAAIASGSYRFDAAVIVPCSMRTLGSIANGISSTLITRIGDICLKEGRKLILVPRETPLSLVHMENMVKIKRAGAMVMPACPSFYSKPKTTSDIIDILVGRILDLLGMENDLSERWSP